MLTLAHSNSTPVFSNSKTKTNLALKADLLLDQYTALIHTNPVKANMLRDQAISCLYSDYLHAPALRVAMHQYHSFLATNLA